LNVVCFTLKTAGGAATWEKLQVFLNRLKEDGTTFCTPSSLYGTPIVRAALCNWRTKDEDIEKAYQALSHCAVLTQTRNCS
jgi:hypothetical protein